MSNAIRLRRKQEAYKAGQKTPYAAQLHREINTLKQTEIPWAYDVSKCAFQEGLRDLDNAFKHFFRKCALKKEGKWKGKCGYPRSKSKKKAIGGCRFTGSIHVYPDAIQFPRMGLLRLKEQNYLPMNAHIDSATISEKAGRWYVSICVHEDVAESALATGEAIGVDLGIKRLATVSDGRTFANPKALRKKINALKRASRRHSRKKKSSANREKAKARLANGKPAPDIFLKAAQELGIAPIHCVVIEDAVAGVQAAHAAGMRCIAVAGNRDLPGLRAAELVVKSLTQVNVEDVRTLARAVSSQMKMIPNDDSSVK